MTLIELPEKAYMVPFSSPLLGVHYQVRELLPLVHDEQRVIPDLVDDLLPDSLQSIITKSIITNFGSDSTFMPTQMMIPIKTHFIFVEVSS